MILGDTSADSARHNLSHLQKNNRHEKLVTRYKILNKELFSPISPKTNICTQQSDTREGRLFRKLIIVNLDIAP